MLALDPGYRTGCKVAIVDENGAPVDFATIYPHAPQNKWDEAKAKLKALIASAQRTVIAIGNGTASRETEQLAAEVIAELEQMGAAKGSLGYVMVNEAGASVYSASEVARQEFPDLDVTQRGTISIGRRLQDPLAELVKIDPKAIGVGMYQHDVDQKALATALDRVVVSCVNFAGVDVNVASAQLLRYVSGVIVARRRAYRRLPRRERPFHRTRAVQEGGGLGSGDLRAGGRLPQDRRRQGAAGQHLHPPGELRRGARVAGAAARRWREDVPSACCAAGASRAGGTPRRRLRRWRRSLASARRRWPTSSKTWRSRDWTRATRCHAPILRQDVLKLEDLKPGMMLQGTVRNVVDFGAFVDIGVKQDGLVHISEMADRFVRDPHTVVAVGQVTPVRVLSVDAARGRIQLSMRGVEEDG